MARLTCISFPQAVLPLAREWIEIEWGKLKSGLGWVLPLAREWIEMEISLSTVSRLYSSPSCEGVD